jgi:hypothetical protein
MTTNAIFNVNKSINKSINNDISPFVEYRLAPIRPTNYKQINQLTYEWIKRVQAANIRVTNRTIELASIEIARSKQMLAFTASHGWVYRFKQQYDLLFDKSTIEGVSNKDLPRSNYRYLCPTATDILNEIIAEDNENEPINSDKASSSSDYLEEDTDQVALDINRNHCHVERVTETEMTDMFGRMRSYCEESAPKLLTHLYEFERHFLEHSLNQLNSDLSDINDL